MSETRENQDSVVHLPTVLEKAFLQKGHHGGFTSVFELNDKYVMKLNRALRFNPETQEFNSHTSINPYLVEQTDNLEADQKKVIEALSELAKEKRNIFDTLKQHLGYHLPNLQLMAVTESPRRDIEQEVWGSAIALETLSKVPEKETTLMEIWENVDPKCSLTLLDGDELLELLTNEKFQKELKSFACAAAEVFFQEKKILDIMDYPGIGKISSDGTRSKEVFEDFFDVEETDKGWYWPTNTAYSNGRLIFYDTFPVLDISPDFYEDMYDIADILSQGEMSALKTLVDDPEVDESVRYMRRIIAQYLFLLQKMGADIVSSKARTKI